MDHPFPEAPSYLRVVPPRCPECERTTTTHVEHVIQGDVVMSSWICTCGAKWPADDDLAPRRTGDDTRPAAGAVVLDDLRDLVAALDRRMPHGDARRERLVSQMSSSLREQAMDRITSLEASPAHENHDSSAPRGER